MTEYNAPLKDLRFTINELADLKTISQFPVFEHATDDLIDPILDEASRFASEVLSPTNVYVRSARSNLYSALQHEASISPSSVRISKLALVAFLLQASLGEWG
jgi:hypothetical protein